MVDDEINVDDEADDTDDTEIDNEVDFETISDDDMKVVVDNDKSIDVLAVDKVFVNVIVEEVGTFLKIISFTQMNFFESKRK